MSCGSGVFLILILLDTRFSTSSLTRQVGSTFLNYRTLKLPEVPFKVIAGVSDTNNHPEHFKNGATGDYFYDLCKAEKKTQNNDNIKNAITCVGLPG